MDINTRTRVLSQRSRALIGRHVALVATKQAGKIRDINEDPMGNPYSFIVTIDNPGVGAPTKILAAEEISIGD